MSKFILVFFATLVMSACAHADDSHKTKNSPITAQVKEALSTKKHAPSNEAYKPYNADADSMVDIDKAMINARQRGTKVLVVMGANWCHDSRALAARFDKPAFKTLIQDNYELIYVSAGTKPGQKDQNRAVSKRFGVDAIEGTPTVFIALPDGTVLNQDSAGFWRRADAIPEDMSYAYFDMYGHK